MTIRHLQIFIAVADTGKMRTAAEQLYISQPSVSQAVRELESHYDVKLFERLNQRIYITDSGKKLLSYARHIVASVEECEAALKAEKEYPLIRIGSSVSVGTAMLEGFLEKYENMMSSYNFTNPSYKTAQGAQTSIKPDIRITINNTAVIEQQILNNDLDIAMVEGNVESQELKQIVVGEDELFMVVGKTHAFYQHPDICIEQLNGEALISRESGSVDRNQFEQFLREQNIHMEKKWNCTNVQAIINSVIAGRGIGILSSLLIQKELASKELKILNINDVHMKRKIKLIYHKNKYLTEAMQRFAEVCTE